MSSWYLARNDELLIDLDRYSRPLQPSGAPAGEVFFRRHLREAIACGRLKVSQVVLWESTTKGHYQAAIKLTSNMGQLERLVWQLYLGSDLHRSRADLMRLALDVKWPSLLIVHRRLTELWREPDAICNCDSKHERNSNCYIFQKYRGPELCDMFGPIRREPERVVPLPLGRVPLDIIMEVRK